MHESVRRAALIEEIEKLAQERRKKNLLQRGRMGIKRHLTARKMRKALEQFSREQGIDPREAMLVAGGAMYLRGMRDDVNDIDFFHAGLPGFVKRQQGRFEMDGGPAGDLPDSAKQWTTVKGMRVQTPESMLAFYQRLNRPKDQAKIKMLERLLRKSRK